MDCCNSIAHDPNLPIGQCQDADLADLPKVAEIKEEKNKEKI